MTNGIRAARENKNLNTRAIIKFGLYKDSKNDYMYTSIPVISVEKAKYSVKLFIS